MQLPSEPVPRAVVHHESLPLRGATQNGPEEQVTAGPSRPGAHAENGDTGNASASISRSAERIHRATLDGKALSGLLADSMRQNVLADHEESNLRTIIQLADELRTFQSPVEFTIGLVGDSGSGKSSLINSVLDEVDLAKAAGSGEACTSVVTEYRYRRETDQASYTLEVDRMNDQEIETLLRQVVVDYRLYHLRVAETFDDATEAGLLTKARLAWDTLTAAFGDRAECTQPFLQDPQVDDEHIYQEVLRWKNELRWPPDFNAQGAVIVSDTAKACQERVEQYLAGSLWPFIKVMRIYLRAPILRSGIVLVDMPGFQDTNTARVQLAETRLFQCDEVFIVTPIVRAATDSGVENIMRKQLGSNLDGLKRSQGVTIICTKSEAYDRKELERDLSPTRELDVDSLRALDNQIEEASDEEPPRPTKYLEARRNHLFINARNIRVSSRILRYYTNHNEGRIVNVFCVSNWLYRDSRELVIQARRRRSSTNTDKTQAAGQMQESSGIPQLRAFVQDIPDRAQIEETRHFLNTRLRSLLEKMGLWLAGNMQAMSVNQDATRTMETSQARLQEEFRTAASFAREDLEDSRLNLLQQPMTQGVNRWQRDALAISTPWNSWNVRSWSAFCLHDGAHVTGTRPWTDWNVELLRPMAADMGRSEEAFRNDFEQAMQRFHETTNNELTALHATIAELSHTERFSQTLPRRIRHLEYGIEEVKAEFASGLESIYHDLLRTHSNSYILRHMKPMYDESAADHGNGLRKRCIDRLRSRIASDPRLFVVIRQLFLASINELIAETNRRLVEAVDLCCQDISGDLDLLRGEHVAAAQDDDVLRAMQEVLEGSRTGLDAIIREFETEQSL